MTDKTNTPAQSPLGSELTDSQIAAVAAAHGILPVAALPFARALLSKLRAPVADELTQQDVFDRFQFLEGLVNANVYRKIAETAYSLYETGAPWPSMAQTIHDLRAELGYVKQYGARVLPDMCPPATGRDRWMYEQGRLAERAALASAPVAGEAVGIMIDEDSYGLTAHFANGLPPAGTHLYAGAAPQASEAVRDAAQTPLLARALAEWHEDDGPVTWWAWCGHEWAGEAPWCGTPLDQDWPGYHTHWTPIPGVPFALSAQPGAQKEKSDGNQ